MSRLGNQRCLFLTQPGADKEPDVTNFGFDSCDLPTELESDEITIRTMYISLDPALRCRMNEDTGVHYMAAWKVGETVLGLGGVGIVTESKNAEFNQGDIIQSLMNWPWISSFNTRTDNPLFPVYKIDPSLKEHPQLVLSLLGMTGLTAYLGVTERGHINSGTNQTVVVSAAAGACGNLAGQMFKLLGAERVIGICGDDKKCSYLKSDLGFDGAINYKTSNITEKLKELCPAGVHVYFDNVGGDMSEQVIKQMADNSHVILCGQIAVYNKDLPYPPPITEELHNIIAARNITRERFLVLTYQEKFAEGLVQLETWYKEGKLKVPEIIHEGLESAAEAFVNMMTSKHQDRVGKQLVRVS